MEKKMGLLEPIRGIDGIRNGEQEIKCRRS
jgi:hypothetical protein